MSNKDNRGILFKNDRKTKDTQPDYTGNSLIKCPNCDCEIKKDMAAWVNKPEGKKAHFALAFNEPYVKPESAPAPAETPDQESDGLPF